MRLPFSPTTVLSRTGISDLLPPYKKETYQGDGYFHLTPSIFMSSLRFSLMALFLPLFTSISSLAEDYVWTGGSGNSWQTASNWNPEAVPGGSSSYTDRMISNGLQSRPVGKLDGSSGIAGLGTGGRYLKGIQINGISTNPGESGLIYILNSSQGVYLRVHDEGVSIREPEGAGYAADFGIAQLRVAADQSWTVEQGRTFYLGADGEPNSGSYSLTSEGGTARTVTLKGGGTVRLCPCLSVEKIDGNISFILDNGMGTPALNMGGKALTNAVSVPSGGILQEAGAYRGALTTGEKAAVTWTHSEITPDTGWTLGAGTAFRLEDSVLDQSGDAPFSGQVTLAGQSGIRGGGGMLTQILEDNATVTYADRTVTRGEILSVGTGVTIILENATLDLGDAPPDVDLVIKGSCSLKGSGTFNGKVTYEKDSSLTADDTLTMPNAGMSVTLTASNISTIDGIRQNGSQTPAQNGPEVKSYIVQFDPALETYVNGWKGAHTFTIEFREGVETVEIPSLPSCFTAQSYDAGTHTLTLQSNIAEPPPMKEGMAGARPNIIFILVDDMGWGELNAFWEHPELNGREVERRRSLSTPALDSMAEEGMQLRRHYTAAPVCAPARASLMLGVHMGHSRVLRNKCFDDPIENSHTLATVLKGAGYDTAAIGKWGIGGGGESAGGGTGYHYSMSATPNQRGFDYFYGIVDHLSGHYHYLGETMSAAKDPDLGKVREYNRSDAVPALRDVKSTVPDTAYDTDMFAARAKKWIMDHHDQGSGKPFFLYLAFPAPHACSAVPACAYPDGGGRNGGLQWVQRDGIATCNTGTEELAREAGLTGPYAKDSYIYPELSSYSAIESRHATMIRRVDDTIADMVQTLKDLGIDDNTMIVFTSDNGPHHEGGADPKHNHGTKNPAYFQAYGMMDGIKKDTWEGGMRMPTLVRWPKYINKGGISLNASQFQDWMATFAEAAGVPVPARCDGVSLLPTLAGVPERQKKSSIYVEYFGDLVTSGFSDFLPAHRNAAQDTDMQQVVYMDGLKGVRRQGGGNNNNRILDPLKDFMIFNTLTDPQEAADLASSRPDLQEKLKIQSARMRRPSPFQTVQKLDDAMVQPVEAPSGLKRGGLRWRAWKRGFDWVPDFRQMEAPDATGKTAGVTVQTIPTLARKGVELSGYLEVPEDGEYTFYLKTDAGEGSKAFVHLHGMQLVDADFTYVPGTEADSRAIDGVSEEVIAKADKNALAGQKVKLKAGLHPIRIGYVGNTAASSLSLEWEGTGTGGREAVPSTALAYEYVNPVSLDKTEEAAGSAATATTLTVQTQLPWTASCDQSWVTPDALSGTGTATLNLAVEANSSETPRTAVVTVSCDGEQRTFTLTQEGAPPLAGYDAWKKDNFDDSTPNNLTAPNACPAGDGISNLMKYATGLPAGKPCGSVTSLSVEERNGNHFLLLAWPVNPQATDVTFSVESSEDLETWTDEGTITPEGSRGEYRDTAPMDDGVPPRRFLRLKVTRI